MLRRRLETYSASSINNPYGAGSRYRYDSPNNPYGEGLSIHGDDGDRPVRRAPLVRYNDFSADLTPNLRALDKCS